MRFFDRFISSIVLPPAFGLDISDFTVKFITFARHRSEDITVRSFGEVAVPEGTVGGGEIKNEDNLAALLEKHLVSQDGKSPAEKFVIATLPEEKSFVHLIQLPKMKEEDARHAVRWELEGIVPMPVEDLYFDYALLASQGDSSDHVDVLVTAFPKIVVDGYLRVLERAGYIPVALELESQAISRALWNGEGKAFIFADFGATRTSFMIIANGSLIFTLSVPLGGRSFDRAIADRLGVSLDEARAIKIQVGLSEKYNGGAVYEALIPLISAIGDEMKKQIAFYRDHASSRHGMPEDISAIVLSGGDANLGGLVNHLSFLLKKEVELGNPLGRLLLAEKFHPPFSRSESLKYAAAIGAALRGVGF